MARAKSHSMPYHIIDCVRETRLMTLVLMPQDLSVTNVVPAAVLVSAPLEASD